MSSRVIVNIALTIHDENEFRDAAYKRALADGLPDGVPDGAEDYLNPDIMSLGQCAIMLMDPGMGPPGSQIDDSSTDEPDSTTDSADEEEIDS